MTPRVFLGSVGAFVYNDIVSKIPSRTIRGLALQVWLGRLGRGAGVQRRCRFLNGPKVHLGERNVINFGCLFDGRVYPIVTGDDVSIGPEAAILTLGHDPQSSTMADRGGPVTIGDRVWIGFRAVILPGVTIGEGAVIGAGAVVSRDVEPYSIMAGNPAVEVGQRNRDLNYSLSYRPWLL